MLRTLNLDGDRQADLSVHGGPSKAVYVYPSEHYDYWKHEFPEMKLPWGMFGENFTTAGLVESEVNIGDKFRVGSAMMMATEPRMPCYKRGTDLAALTSSKDSLRASARVSISRCCNRAESEWVIRSNSSKKAKTV